MLVPVSPHYYILPWSTLARGAMKVSPYKIAIFFIVHWIVMMGLWVLYTSTATLYELLVGTAAALLAAIGTAIVQEKQLAKFAPNPKWLLYFAYMPWYAAKDTLVVFRAAFKYMLRQKSDGYLLAVNFDAGGDDPRSSARRALEIALTTIPPNSIVIGIDRKGHKMLMHLLRPSGMSWVTRELGASE